MDDPLQEGARGQDHPAGGIDIPLGADHPLKHAIRDHQIFDGVSDDGQVGGGGEFSLHGPAIEFAVNLRPGTAYRRPLGAVQHAELDAGLVGQTAHDPVQGVDLPHQVPLAQAANGRVAAHLADGFQLVGQQ